MNVWLFCVFLVSLCLYFCVVIMPSSVDDAFVRGVWELVAGVCVVLGGGVWGVGVDVVGSG